MHKSLTPRNNLLLMLVWAVVVGAFTIVSAHPNKALMLGVGAALGLIAGVLQLRALQEGKERFLAATTALEVRAAMASSKAGRFAIFTLYGSAGLLLLTAFMQKEVIAFGLLAGFAAFALVRDGIALKGCISLQKEAAEKKTA